MVNTGNNRITFIEKQEPENQEKNKGTQTTTTDVNTETNGDKSNKETEKDKPIDKKTEKTEIEVKEKPENNQDKEKPETDKNESGKLKISFGNEKQQPEKKPDEKETKSDIVVNDEIVSSYLKEKYGIEKPLSELSNNQTSLPESVKKFIEYNKETGRGIEDFYNAQRDWSKQPKDETIREYYKYKHPNLSEEMIETQLELLKLTEEEKDDLTERELKQHELKYEKAYSEALSFMTEKAKTYTTKKETQQIQKKLTPEEIAKQYRPYWDKRDKSLENLNEVKLTLEGLGDIVVPITPEQKKMVEKSTQTLESYIQNWQNEDGSIDTDRTVEDVLWSIPDARKHLISQILEQANVLILDNFSKTNRNVDLNKAGQQQNKQESNASFKVHNNTNDNNFNKPLF